MARRKAAIPVLLALCTVAYAGVTPTIQAPNAVRKLDKALLTPSELAYVVTPENVGQILRSVATPNKEVIFTTLVFDANATGVDMVQNFCYWLDRQGLLDHTMILATDNHTWEALHARGLPGYWDTAWPIPAYIPEGAIDVPGSDDVRTFDLQKHWWGLQVVKHGYKALYLDSDAIVLQNPLQPFADPYDVQGLSDWQDAELPPTGGMVWRDCGNYKWAPIPKDKHLPYGAALYTWWHLRTYIQKARAQPLPNPCQSTGVWYLQPNEVTVRFMTTLYNRLTEEFKSQWDQTAWNEIVMGYVVGMGNDIPAMRYRLLPHSQYSNIDVARMRKAQGLPVDQVILHAGYYHGKDKAGNYSEQGLYHPDFLGHISKAGGPASRRLSTALPASMSSGVGCITWVYSSLSLSMMIALIMLGCMGGLFVWPMLLRKRPGPRHARSSWPSSPVASMCMLGFNKP